MISSQKPTMNPMTYMPKVKITPSTHPSTFFPQIAGSKTMGELSQTHANLIKTGEIHDPLAAAEILKFYALSSHQNMQYACLVFRQIQEPNCFSWNTIIRALAESNEKEDQLEALLLFSELVSDDFVDPNRFTFPSVLKACARTSKIQEGKQVHGLAVKFRFDSDAFVISNLVRMYAMCGLIEDAHALFLQTLVNFDYMNKENVDKRRREGNVVLWNVLVDGYIRVGDFQAAKLLFDKMSERSIISWNVMISAYAQNGFFKEAIELFHEMQIGEISPNYVTLVSILPAISRLGALELGKWVHLYAEKHKMGIDDVFGSALVDMYSKCGSIEEALQIFERLPKKNPITWNAMIGGLSMHGRAIDAFDYFSRMERYGVTPNDVTYIGLLSACSYGGFVAEGRSYFNHMINVVKLEPRIEHYGCMVDLLGRAGLLDEAEEIISKMPMKPDDVIWKALLGACKKYQNKQIGKRVAEILMDLAPHDSGSYVALSNIYASSEQWNGVADVRLKMKEMDVRKDPGGSWIEIDGIIHEFLVEDSSHPQADEIHKKLEEISSKLALAGYEPNTSQVLINVDEREKISLLNFHSEKIATAFGLINTSSQTPLRIVKNLRICEDCHSSIKLISSIYKCRIIVRDRKRFHHFENGSCSCMDYW